MDKQRTRFLDSLWMNSDVGKWLELEASGNRESADRMLQNLFDAGHLNPLEYLLEQEKEITKRLKNEFRNLDEAREYLTDLDERKNEMVDVMVAYDFSLIDIYYE